ncbi:unnamed protein product, partial [Closterium sp. NIES-54]
MYDEVNDDLLYDNAKEDEELPELDPDMHADPEHRWDIATMMVKEVLASWKGKAVKAAMEEEIRNLVGMGTWELVERPRGVNIMKNRWVLTTKYRLDDTVEREKARLVVKGFTQVCGADYDKAYSPVSCYVTLRIFLSIVTVLDLNLMQLDMKNAFLQSKLDRVLYMYQPDYFDDGTGQVCKLLKSLYGLKQSPLLWYRALDGVLLGAGWKKSQVNEALYYKAGDIGVTCWYLGLEIMRDRPTRKLWLHQQGYADKLHRRFVDEEQGGRVPKTPISVDAYAQLTFDDEEAQERKEEEYRHKVGSLQFVATTTRPDIAFACSKLGSGLTVRSDQHWREVDRCLAYLSDTRDTALEFGGGPESLEMIGYMDADDAGDKQNSRIKCATLSSTESEYVAATNAGKEGRRLRFLLAEFKLLDAGKPTILCVDNNSAITVAEGLGLTGNLKHMERRYAWLQHMVRRGKFVLKYIPTTEQPADFLTKALHFPAFNRCSVAIGQVRLADSESPHAEPGGAEFKGAESGGTEPRGTTPARGPAGTGVGGTRATSLGGAGAAGPRGARTRGTGAARAGGVGGAGAGNIGAGGTGGGGARAGGPGPGGARARGAGAGGAGAGGTGAGGTVQRRPFFVPPQPSSLPPPDSVLRKVLSLPSSTGLTPPLLCPPPDQSQPQLRLDSPLPAPSPYAEQTDSPSECREPASRPALPVRAGRRIPRPRPRSVPGTHVIALRPSFVPLRVPLSSPPASSLPGVPDPEFDLARAASPTVPRLLATFVTEPLFESTAASALVAELVDFAATCCLDYAASLVAESKSDCPLSVRGECALGTDVLKDRQEDFECLAAAVPHLVAMLLAPKGDPDAPDIPTTRSYAEEIMGPYSSQWQTAMDAEMTSWKSTGTYDDAIPPSGANIGVDFFQTFSPTPKMTTLRVLLHVAAQRDYELHSLDSSAAFLQGSLHEEIWLRRPPGFTKSFPAGAQWSLRRPVYGLRQAPREWHDTLRMTLAAMGFAPLTADPSLFLRTDTLLPPFCILVCVDDLVFATDEAEALALVKSELQKRHTCNDMGPSALRLPVLLATVHSSAYQLTAPLSDDSVEPSGPYLELVGCLMPALISGGLRYSFLAIQQHTPCSHSVALPCSYSLCLPPTRCALLQPAIHALLPCPARAALPCSPRPAALQPVQRAALPLGPRAALPCSPARRALLPRALRPASTRASRSAAPRIIPSCSPHVAPCCSQRVAPYCSPRVAPCCPAQCAPCCPVHCAPCPAARSAPCLAQPRRPAWPSRAAQPKPPCPTRAAPPYLDHQPHRAARATAAAAGGAARSAGSAAGAGGAGGATGSDGGAAGAGGAGGATRNARGATGAEGAGPTTNHHCLSWPLSRQLQRLGQQSQQETFSPHVLSELVPQRCVTGSVEVAAPGASESAAALGASESAAALGASESAAALDASESAAALGARASPATGPSSAKALHPFTLDSGASRCFFRDCTTLTPLAALVPVSLADPTGGPVVARASTVLLCPPVPSGSLSGLHLPMFSTSLVSNAAIEDVWVDSFIPGGQRVAICQVAASSQVSASGQLVASCS